MIWNPPSNGVQALKRSKSDLHKPAPIAPPSDHGSDTTGDNIDNFANEEPTKGAKNLIQAWKKKEDDAVLAGSAGTCALIGYTYLSMIIRFYLIQSDIVSR